MHLETVALHGGYTSDDHGRSTAVPIYHTVGHCFDSAEHAAALFNLDADGYRYGRISNPTTAVLESRLALLEGGTGALAVSSGQAALHYAVLNLLDPGCNIVSVPQIYGTTHTLFMHLLPTMGMSAVFAPTHSPAAIAACITPKTRAIFCESVGNPAGNICDIAELATIAHSHGLPLIVDNTVATPFQLRPVQHGADIVVHSLTKYLGGHGTTLGGAIIDGGRFDWAEHAECFPMFSTPDPSYHGMVYTERFGTSAFVARCRSVYLRIAGAALSPFSAFLLLQGIETAALRVERQVRNAHRTAEFLSMHPDVAWVDHASLTDSPYHRLAGTYLEFGAPAILTLGVNGGYDAAVAFYDSLKLVKRVVNLGDAKTLACHPASTTHRQMTPTQQRSAGVYPEAIRLSIGIEHVDDIIADLDQALAVAQTCVASHAAPVRATA